MQILLLGVCLCPSSVYSLFSMVEFFMILEKCMHVIEFFVVINLATMGLKKTCKLFIMAQDLTVECVCCGVLVITDIVETLSVKM